MQGPQRNFDLLQLEEKASHAMQVGDLYARRPEWDRGSRRLTGSLDHWNTRSLVDGLRRCAERERPASVGGGHGARARLAL